MNCDLLPLFDRMSQIKQIRCDRGSLGRRGIRALLHLGQVS
jgi:hypothetical protein